MLFLVAEGEEQFFPTSLRGYRIYVGANEKPIHGVIRSPLAYDSGDARTAAAFRLALANFHSQAHSRCGRKEERSLVFGEPLVKIGRKRFCVPTGALNFAARGLLTRPCSVLQHS